MYRNVEINIPMFIGIILLVAVVTAGLVFCVNTTINLIEENNNKHTSTVNEIDDLFGTNKNVQDSEENSNLIDSNINDTVNSENLV